MGSGKKKKKKRVNQNGNVNTSRNSDRAYTAAAPADTPETPKMLTNFNQDDKRIQNVLLTTSPFPSPILSPTPTPAKKMFPKSSLDDKESTKQEEKDDDDDDDDDEAVVKEKKLNFQTPAIVEKEATTKPEETTLPSPSQACVGTKQPTQTTLLLETNRDLRSALADSVNELASLEEDNERLREEIRKEIEIVRPKLIAEACEDLSERLKRAEVAIERERREASSGKLVLAELHTTKQKLADALKLAEEHKSINATDCEKNLNENDEQKEMETERIRVMKDALEKAEDRVLVMFADLNATKVELNRLREENTELKTKHALSETKLSELLNQREEEQEKQHNQMTSPRAVKEELELANLMKKNAEMRDKESHKKVEEAERQKEAAVKVLEKLRTENDEMKRAYEKLRKLLVEQDRGKNTDEQIDSEKEISDAVGKEASVKKRVVPKKRERPSVLRLPSFAWYFISGSDKAPEFLIEEDDS